MKFLWLLVLGIVSLVWEGLEVRAEEEATVTVTATRVEQEVTEVSPMVEVVEREEIEAIAADNLEDALKYGTSIYFYQHMLRPTPSIRGFEGKHVLILTNGRRYAGPQGKYDDPIRQLAGNVERIEVVRGPMSALYGSEAMGGVINIITKRPVKSEYIFDIKYGKYSHGGYERSGYFNLLWADPERHDWLSKFDFSLTGNFYNLDPLKVGPNQTTLLADTEVESLSLSLGYQLGENWRLEFEGGVGETRKEHFLMSRGRLTRSRNEYPSWDLGLALKFDRPDRKFMLRGYTSHYEKDYRRHVVRTGELDDLDEGERETHVLEFQGTQLVSDFLGAHLLTAGGEFRREEYRSVRIARDICGTASDDGLSKPIGCYEQDVFSFYLQDEWQWTDWFTFVPAIRMDDYEDQKAEWSPKVGAIFRLTPISSNLRLKLNYGHGFRVPEPEELFFDYYGMGGRYHIVGNPDLRPEESDTYEAALEWTGSKLFARLAYFYSDIEDLIDFVFVGFEGATRVLRYETRNINEATIQGFEVEAEWVPFENLRLGVNYTYLDAIDDTNKERLSGRPRHLAHFKIDYSYLPWDLTINLRGKYIGDYGFWGGSFNNPEFKTDHEFTFSIRIAKEVYGKGEIYVGIDDISDEFFYDGKDGREGVLERPGSFYYAGFKINF